MRNEFNELVIDKDSYNKGLRDAAKIADEKERENYKLVGHPNIRSFEPTYSPLILKAIIK